MTETILANARLVLPDETISGQIRLADGRIADQQNSLGWLFEVPGSAELFGTRKGVRADVVIDGIPLPNVGLLVTGTGGHMLSVSAALRRRLGKELGDAVTVRLERRLT